MRSLFRELVILKYRADDDHDKRMTLAWTTVVLKNQRRLPTLKSLLTPQRAQTVQEKRDMLERLSQATGIPLRKRKKKKKVNRG